MARTKRAALVGDDAADGSELCCSGHIGTLVGIGLAAAHVDPFDFAYAIVAMPCRRLTSRCTSRREVVVPTGFKE
jgi:hypothetical protein